MLISVNNIRKASGTSTFSIALGILLSQATDFTVLLIDGSYMYSDVDQILGVEPDRGIDDVLDLLNSNKLNEKLFKDIALEFGNFYLIAGSKVAQYNRFDKDDINFNKIFNIAESLFDIVIVDEPTRKMSSYLDERIRTNEKYLSIQLAKQNFLIFEKYAKSKEFNMDKSLIVLNKYWDGRKLNKTNIINEYKITLPVFTLRHSDKLMEAFNDRLIDRYLLNENDGFIEDMKVIMNFIAESFKFQLNDSYTVKKNVMDSAKASKKKGLFW